MNQQAITVRAIIAAPITAGVEFKEVPGGVMVTKTFDPENENPEQVQRFGWQAILDNFKAHVESRGLE